MKSARLRDTMPKRTKRTTGYLNKLIDDVVHPYVKNYPALIIVDALLHGIVEQDPKTSLTKFVRYNSSTLLKQVTRNTKHRRKPRIKRTT